MASLTTNVLQTGTEADRRHAVEAALASVGLKGWNRRPTSTNLHLALSRANSESTNFCILWKVKR
jgi:hypothetical protein